MLKEAIEKIMSTAVKAGRESKIVVTDYGTYSSRELEALWNDTEDGSECNIYDIQKPVVAVRKVSNIDSLIAAVEEELKRQGKKDGEKASMSFNQAGGFFQPDDDFSRGINYEYNRKFSNQWKTVVKLLSGGYMNHFELIQAIQSLKPSLGDVYLEVMSFYSKLKLNSSSQLVSQPTFTNNGELGEGYTVNFMLDSGNKERPDAQTGEQYLPTKLNLKLPYVKNSTRTYGLELEIVIIRKEGGGFAAGFICPGFEEIEEQAMRDEIDKFKDAMFDAEIIELLIVESF
jgi:hypothetical protein